MTEVQMTQNDDIVIVYDPRATVMIDDESVSVKTDLPVDVIAEPPPIDPPPIDPPEPPDPERPPAPTNLRVTMNSSGFQRIEWDEPDMVVDGYLVFRKIEGQDDDYQPVGIPSYAGGPRYNSHGLPSDTLISYRVVYGDLDFDPVSNYAEVSEKTEEQTVAPPPVDGDTNLRELLYYENFEGCIPGLPVQAQTRLGGADMGAIVSGEHYPGVGSKCMRTIAPARDSGYGKWGFIIENAPWLPSGREGTEIWVRWATKVPSDWDNQADPWMKNMRMRSESYTGEPKGYSDCYLKGRRHALISERDNDNGWKDLPSIWNVQRGKWEVYEFYTKFNSRREAGNIRMWKNGVPIGSHNSKTGERFAGILLWHTYYNGEPSKPTRSMESWIDQLAIAAHYPGMRDDRQHMSSDSTGHPIIGMAMSD